MCVGRRPEQRNFRVGRMTLYLKISPANEIILLWCGSMSVLTGPDPRWDEGGQASERANKPAPIMTLDEALQQTDRYVRPRIPKTARAPPNQGTWNENGHLMRTSSSSTLESWRTTRFNSKSFSSKAYTTRAYHSLKPGQGWTPAEPVAPRPRTPVANLEPAPAAPVTETGTRARCVVCQPRICLPRGRSLAAVPYTPPPVRPS